MQTSETSSDRPSQRSHPRRQGPGRRTLLSLAALTVCVASALVAARQEGRPDPYRPYAWGSLDWWLHPVERNAFRRIPAISTDLHAVVALSDGQHLWAVGDGGLALRSEDGGRSWTQGVIDAGDAALPSGVPTAQEAEPPSAARAAIWPDAGGLLRALRGAGLGAAGGPESRQQQYPTQQSPVQQAPISKEPPQEQKVEPDRFTLPQRGNASENVAPIAEEESGSVEPYRPAVPVQRESLLDVFFLDAQRGWAVGENGRILRTSNGGAAWALAAEGAWGALTSIHLSAEGFGWAVGEGVVVRTTDGGETWRAQQLDPMGRILDVDFAGSLGWAVGERGLLFHSEDGERWTETESPPADDLVGVDFVDERTGWVVGYLGESRGVKAAGAVYRTTDGGRSWHVQVDSVPELTAVRFADAGTGIVVGAEGTILVTHDGGTSWSAVDSGTRVRLTAVYLAGAGQGWVAGEHGTLLSTDDGGQSWRILAGAGGRLTDVSFVDAERGWAVGGGGSILATRDGGRVWHPQDSGTRETLRAVSFVDRRTGWAVGDNGTILRTSDAGAEWTLLQYDDPEGERPRFTAVHFVDALTGWAADAEGAVYLTRDGGRTWQRSPGLFPTAGIYGLHFLDERRGWASGDLGLTYRTEDGGLSWQAIPTPVDSRLHAVTFVDERLGWAAGLEGTLLVTRTGGSSWMRQEVPVRQGLLDIAFTSPLVGWAVGWDGTLLATADGGARWQVVESGTPLDLNALAVAGDTLAWAVGEGGAILRTAGDRSWHLAAAEHGRWPAPWYYLSWLVVVGLLMAIPDRRPPPAVDSVADLLISDRPLSRGDPDPVDLNGVALGMSRFLRNEKTDPPLTIAVTGAWGTGKTSLMSLVMEDLRYYGFRPVWFNAWHHQTEEHLLASLLSVIRLQAIPPWLSVEGLVFRANLLRIRMRRHRAALVALLLLTATYLGYLAAAPTRWRQLTRSLPRALPPQEEPGTPEGVLETIQQVLGSLLPAPPQAGSGWLVVLAGLGSLAALLRGVRAFGVNPGSLLASVSRAVRVKDLEAQTGFRNRFATEFREVTEALHPRDMVIFVDDLDRCHPEQVLEVLEAINFLVSSGECVVIMGMDPERVIRCVGLGFKDVAEEFHGTGTGTANEPDANRRMRADYARHYLEKLVNIEVPVPTATTDQLGELLAPEAVQPQIAPDEARPVRWKRIVPRRVSPAVAYALAAVLLFSTSQALFRPPPPPAAADGAAPFAARGRDNPGPDGGSVPPDLVVSALVSGNELPQRLREGRLVPASRESDLPVAPFTLFGVVALVAAGWRLLERPEAVVRDSQPFKRALWAWAPVIVEKFSTPRAAKRFLNRLRYYAMRQRAHTPPVTLGERLIEVLRRQPVLTPLLRKAGLEERIAREAPDAIPEEILVALAALHECRPHWEADSLYGDFRGSIEKGDLPDEVKRRIRLLRYPDSVQAYRGRFARVSSGIRMT